MYKKMHRKTLILIFTTIWLLIWASPSIALDNAYKKAIDAYKNEDYETSHKSSILRNVAKTHEMILNVT